MSYGDVVAEIDAVKFLHAVQNAIVLNVGIMSNADLMNIAAQHGIHPDTGMFANGNVSDELGRIVDVASFGKLWRDAFVGADHGF